MSKTYFGNFWQGFTKLDEEFLKKRKEYSKLYYIFSQLQILKNNYYQGLTDLIKYFQIQKEDFTYEKALKQLMNQLQREADLTLGNINCINSKILPNMKMKLQTHYAEARQNKKEFFDKDYQFQENLTQLEKSKEKFHSCVAKSTQAYLDFLIVQYKKKRAAKQEKFKRIEEEAKNEANELKREYENKIHETNNIRLSYISQNEKTLKRYQELDKELFESIQEEIMKYSEDHMKALQDLKSEIENNNENFYLKIEPEKDILDFISKYKTIGYEPGELEFIAFKEDNMILESQQYEKSDKFDIKQFDGEIRKYLNNNFQKKEEKEPSGIQQEIYNLVIASWEGNLRDDELIRLYDYFIQNQEYQFLYLKYLKKYHEKEKSFNINGKGYEIVSTILNKILNLNGEEDKRNYIICRFGITLAQTYKKEKDIYIIKALKGNKIFTYEDFWVGLAKNNINADLHNKTTYLDYPFELTDKKIDYISRIAKSKTILMVQNMESLEMQKDFITSVVTKLCMNYNLPAIDIMQCVKGFQE